VVLLLHRYCYGLNARDALHQWEKLLHRVTAAAAALMVTAVQVAAAAAAAGRPRLSLP
jgi:hypothetical protein